MTLEEYQSPDHRQTRAAVERHFETLTAATVDVAKTICRLESVAVPIHRKDVIRAVESCGIIAVTARKPTRSRVEGSA
ncbi:hypothetical protein RH831_09335 [Halodesulfurarchaeum sp. HSR-GB]|nr:hypothetical protein [Halodesulfurarchaeum sp. HSR-GB]MDR5657381.1 hypothetical protein [Halodesulfurarchaeum sp. HSR-GB]